MKHKLVYGAAVLYATAVLISSAMLAANSLSGGYALFGCLWLASAVIAAAGLRAIWRATFADPTAPPSAPRADTEDTTPPVK